MKDMNNIAITSYSVNAQCIMHRNHYEYAYDIIPNLTNQVKTSVFVAGDC